MSTLTIYYPEPPLATSIQGRIVGSTAIITWEDNLTTGTLPPTAYDVLFDNKTYSVAATPGSLSNSVTVTLPTNTTGAMPVSIRKWDSNNPLSNSLWVTKADVFSLASPSTVSNFSCILVGKQFKLTWDPIASPIVPIDYYEVGYADNTILGKVYTTVFIQDANWSGSRTFWIRSIDILGNSSSKITTLFNINIPNTPTVKQITVIDNNVLLYWEENSVSTSQLPVLGYYLRRRYIEYTGASLLEVIGDKSGGFTTILETKGNTYTYELAARDTASTLGGYASRTVLVSQPPDYLLLADKNSSFTVDTTALSSNSTGTVFVSKTNIVTDTDGSILLPVAQAESWQGHFIDHNWNTIQDIITDEQPIFASPGNTSATYEEIIDYKAVIPNSKITVTATKDTFFGTPNYITNIYTTLGKEYACTVTTSNIFTVSSTGSRSTTGTMLLLNKNLVGSYSQVGTTITITTANSHGLTSGDIVVLDFIDGGTHDTSDDTIWSEFLNTETAYSSNFRFVKCIINVNSAKLASYNIVSGSYTINITCTSHGLVSGDKVLLDFISGGANFSSDNLYTIVVSDSNNFSVTTSVLEGLSSGTVHVYSTKFSGLVDISNLNIKLDSKLKTITGMLKVRVPTNVEGYYQVGANITIQMPSTTHGITTGEIINISMYTGTYTQTGTTITVSCTNQVTVGESIILDFNSGSAKDSTYVVMSANSTSFTVNTELQATTSGSVKISKGLKVSGTTGSQLYAIDSISATKTILAPTIDAEGTLVYLTTNKSPTGSKEFIDVDAIALSASGTSPITSVYDFVDTSKPSFFRALLFNTAGNRVEASCSYTVRGF